MWANVRTNGLFNPNVVFWSFWPGEDFIFPENASYIEPPQNIYILYVFGDFFIRNDQPTKTGHMDWA